MSRSTRAPFVGSLSIHLVVLLALIAVRDARKASKATETAPRVDVRMVYLHANAAGGGGGGGGTRSPEPTRRAEARGSDQANVPIAPPPTVTPSSDVALEPEVASPVLAAV